MADWLSQLWDTMKSVSLPLVVLGLSFQTLQTLFISLAWRNILRGAYPKSVLPYREVLSYYAGGAGLNSILPASAGTVAMLGLYRTAIAGSTVAGLVGATLVQNIFFVIVAAIDLPVAVPERGRLVRRQVRLVRGPRRADADHRGRWRGADLRRREDPLAAPAQHLGAGQGRRRHPHHAEKVHDAGGPGRGVLLRGSHGRERDLHVRLPHTGLAHEHLPDRRGLVDLLHDCDRAGGGRARRRRWHRWC